MGNTQQQGKFKPKRVNKTQVEIACLKVKAHLELVKDRKSNEVIKAEKTLNALIKGTTRNKTEELLQAEKIINDLKYIQACTTLIAYSNTLRNFAGMIAESGGQAAKVQELMVYIYSIMYASKFLGLFSLNEFREMMLNFFGTEAVPIDTSMVDPKIEECFRVKPTPFEVNTYFLEMGQRNNITLEKINEIHQFSNNPIYTPPVPAHNPMNNPMNNQMNNPMNNQMNMPNPYGNPNQYAPYGAPNQMGPPSPTNYRNTYPITSDFHNDPFAQPQQPFNPQGNPYQNGPNNGQNQPKNDFFIPPVMPIPSPTVANPVSKAPVIQPPAFNNFDNIGLKDINNIEDIPMYPEMNFDFKNMGPPGGMNATKNVVQPVVPQVSPILPPLPMDIPMPAKDFAPVGFPDLTGPTNPFPPSAKEFIPGPSKAPQMPEWGPPSGPSNGQWNQGFDANFDQICEQIRKGL